VLKRFFVCLLLLALTACGDGKSFSEPLVLETPGPGHERRIQRVRFTMSVAGAENFTFTKETKLRFDEIARAVPVSLWFISISAPTDPPITIPDGRQILFTADLAPGLYRGAPKTYELSGKTQGDVLGVPTNLESAAYITITQLTPTLASASYDLANARYEKPCTLTLAKELVSGSVSCPKLADAKGKTISLGWRWEWI